MLSSLKVEKLVFGVGLVGLGVALTLANFDRIDLLATLRRWWPMLLIVWGVLELMVALGRRAAGER